jgi:hypothetical protein
MTLTEVLDSVHLQLRGGTAHDAMEDLINHLSRLRLSMPEASWQEAVSVCRLHPICSDLLQDPLTQRSFRKPRGYSGDAVILDMIYGCCPRNEFPGNDMGKAVFCYTAGSGRSPQAVRYRRSTIARIVDEMSESREKPRILSIASGHLREVELSKAFNARMVQEWVAVDQDEESLLECDRSYAGTVVRSMKGSVRRLLSRRLCLGQFDFVYAAGLFDYLSVPIAEALVSRMFEMLKPSGRLMVANFATGFVDAGYMEAFMDWKLIYRSQQELTSILDVLNVDHAIDVRVASDPWNAIHYATATKRAEGEGRSSEPYTDRTYAKTP